MVCGAPLPSQLRAGTGVLSANALQANSAAPPGALGLASPDPAPPGVPPAAGREGAVRARCGGAAEGAPGAAPAPAGPPRPFPVRRGQAQRGGGGSPAAASARLCQGEAAE